MLKRNLMALICLGLMSAAFAAYPQNNMQNNTYQGGQPRAMYPQNGGASPSTYQNGASSTYQNGGSLYQNGAAPQNGGAMAPAPAGDAGRVQWFTNYNQALVEAKKTGRPMVLFFTGSDWCGWCKKMVNEVFNSPDFAREVGNAFIFVEVDFPMNKQLSQLQQQQNNLLKQKYAVTGYPTIIILDSNENFIAETGYRPGGGKAYADYLKQFLS